MTLLRRIPLTLRALVLVPLLAVLVDAMRATLACGPQAETCLEAAGRGWLGAAGLALLAPTPSGWRSSSPAWRAARPSASGGSRCCGCG